MFPPRSVGEQVCDVPDSRGLLLVTCLMVSRLIPMAQEGSVGVIDEAEISWGKTLSVRPIMTIFFYQKCLFPSTITSLHWEAAIPKGPWVTILLFGTCSHKREPSAHWGPCRKLFLSSSLFKVCLIWSSEEPCEVFRADFIITFYSESFEG